MVKCIGALVAAAAIVAPASANRISAAVDSLYMDLGDAYYSQNRGVSYSENFETFPLGTGIVNGWTAPSFIGNSFVVDHPKASFATRSMQHVSDDSGVAGFEMAGPQFAIETGVLNADVIISNNTSLYQMITVNNTSGFFNTRLNFETNGTIRALQAVGGVGVFSNTTGAWTPGVTTRIGIEVPGDGSLTVWQDGAVIFTGVDIPFALGNPSLGISQFTTFAANAAAAAMPTMTVDNINMQIPAPGALALFGAAGLAGLRRRRA